MLAIEAKGYVPTLQDVFVADGMAPVDIRLEVGRTISGRVLDEENKPIDGASVAFGLGSSDQGILTDQGIRLQTTADQDGRFRLDGLPAAGGSIVARHRTTFATSRIALTDKNDALTIVIPKPAKVLVRGTVTDLESGQPIPAFNVVLRGSVTGRHLAAPGQV